MCVQPFTCYFCAKHPALCLSFQAPLASDSAAAAPSPTPPLTPPRRQRPRPPETPPLLAPVPRAPDAPSSVRRRRLEVIDHSAVQAAVAAFPAYAAWDPLSRAAVLGSPSGVSVAAVPRSAQAAAALRNAIKPERSARYSYRPTQRAS
jgi:hypothetical protein